MPPILPIEPADWQPVRPVYRGPTTAELFTRALCDTDFLGDLTPTADLERMAVDATDIAIETWEAANDDARASTALDVPADVVETVRRMLVSHGRDRLLDAADAANDARLDARESGDVDAGGDAVPYDTYRRV